tara:strand:- start:9604 stop:16758 length:7155 start_codon:yes stop_codon:yes gene_type:complete
MRKTKRNLGVMALCAIAFLSITVSVQAQTFLVKPAKAKNTDGNFVSKLLLKQSEPFKLEWATLAGGSLNLTGKGAKLLIGRSSNSYNVLEVAATGTAQNFTPKAMGLSAGRYYARITNSTARTADGIQSDSEKNPSSIVYSNEILLLIEANEAPSIIGPRGKSSNATPTFQWSAVSGVPSYWLIVSSTPFDIVEDEDANISIEGATVVWQYITKNTTASYGAINRESPFTDEAPPLNAGEEYSYTILNVYEENNPVFTSPVFGGIVPFTYTNPDALPKVTLKKPLVEETFFGKETIVFEWEKVPSVANYTINLLQIVKQQGIDVTVQIWASTTTNTSIEYPALENLKNGRYQWNVISNNSSGGGTTSKSRYFNYKVDTGEFGAKIQSKSDNSNLLGVELKARAINGGVTPSIPYFVQSETHYDSLVVGTYEFTAAKAGYEDATAEVVIKASKQTSFSMKMTPLPSSIGGTILDNNGAKVSEAKILVTDRATGVVKEVSSNVNGQFSVSLNKGSYTLLVSKSGFISPASKSITLSLNQQLVLSESLVLVNDQATISGFVYNDSRQPVQRVAVTITNGTRTYETKTNGSGLYQFTVASGSWTLKSTKVGFVEPASKRVSLSTGDILQNQDFTLIGNANQVTGFIRERITNSDGSIGTAPFQGITVTAVPNVGTPISVVSSKNGQFTLSLKSGAYSIQANKDNYTSNQDRELVIGIAIGETISGMDFELIPNPSSISGTVTLPNGNGVSDANVTIQGVGSTITSSSGYFTLRVPQGSHKVTVSKTGLVSPSPKTVTVIAGQKLTGVNYEMTPNAGTISGRVTSNGEALSNTSLSAYNATTGKTVELLNKLDGTYNFNLQSGRWAIKAVKSGFISDSLSALNIGPGQLLVNQNFSLKKNLTTIRGTVTDGFSQVRSAQVTITRGSDFNQSTVTQVSGVYAFSVPAGQAYTITASKDGFRSATVNTDKLVAGTTVANDFVISANPSSVSGTVRITNGGILASAKVIAFNSNGTAIDSTVSKSDGSYLLGLNPGNYSLKVSKLGYTGTTKSTTLSIGQKLTGIDFNAAENFAFISGTVNNSGSEALEQVFVNVSKQGGGGASSVTDAGGSFSISKLTAGVYTIEFSTSGYINQTVTKVIKDGDFVSLTPALVPKNGIISGTISDEDNAAIDDASVTLTHSNGNQYAAVTNINGAYSVGSLELGDYVVTASKTGYSSSAGVEVSLIEAELNKSDVNISDLVVNNATITGVITNEITSATLKDVEVSALGERGSGFALTNAAGQFELTNLSPGDFTLITLFDGYKADTTTITIAPSNLNVTSNRTMIPNNGKIVGKITNPDGSSLPFRVTVTAISDVNNYTTQTNATGDFTIEGVETGVEYTITTDIFKDGYENIQEVVDVPFGAATTELEADLEIVVKNARISGNVSLSDASVTLINPTTNQIVKIATSATDGSYAFDFLPAGDYRVEVQKQGYIFTPLASDVITLAYDGVSTQNFTSQANVATLDVLVKVGGKGVSNTDVTIISADTTVILTQRTDNLGLARFTKIKASTEYLVRPVLVGYSASPVTKSISLNSGDSLSTSFTMAANSSSLSGVVKNVTSSGNKTLSSAIVTVVQQSSGRTEEATTSSNGKYAFANLSSGSYTVIANKVGFTPDTVSITIKNGEAGVANDLVLTASRVTVKGSVKLNGEPVKGLEVTVQSSSSFTATTNSNGQFTFQLPLKEGATDTTVYQVKITSGVFSKSYLLSLTTADVGKTKTVSTTHLPSGKIQLSVSDGISPISGAEINFGILGGAAESEITGDDGVYTSEGNLRKAKYVVSASKEGYLYPSNTITVDLATDTTILERDVYLPYQQLSVTQILADQKTKVKVVNTAGYNNSRATGVLYYKQASTAQFLAVNMVKNGDSLSASLPVFGSVEEVSFYTAVTDSSRNNTYLSSQTTIAPLASGILSSIRITPTLVGQTIRAGDKYNLELFVRDGINKSLEDKFDGEEALGGVTWSVLTEESGINLTEQEGTGVKLLATKAGTYKVKVSVNLEGKTISQSIDLEVTSIPIKEISVSSPAKQVANSNTHVFSYSAVDTSGGSVMLGESLQWNVVPTTAGAINSSGLFEPASENAIGSFSIQVSDPVSETVGVSDVVELTAQIEPDKNYTLTNGNGLQVSIQEGSVDVPSQLSLGETEPAKTKKFVFAQGTDISYTVADKIYVLSFSGSDLKKNATLSLPEDSSLALNEGAKEIGYFNFTTLQWEILDKQSSKSVSGFNSAGSVEVTSLGQFAVLAENEPLGIKYAAVLPSPFSPDIAPLRLGYFLNTAFPPAKVNIRIFNIKGELVRTLLEDDLQQPGRYGSASSLQELTWDGLTDGGNLARNGRYVIEIRAKDQQDEKVKLLQVVLIK